MFPEKSISKTERTGKAFYLLLSEKETVSTCTDGKSEADGAIEATEDGFVMHTADAHSAGEETARSFYPIRKVERIDIDTINAVAAELQEGILKESIEKHFA
ncbi:MAG: hypothetical protein K5697_11945 [Lachnospiraceae bacterium]|nr:hypothetical protein [Lachnospiraceae bacterium]